MSKPPNHDYTDCSVLYTSTILPAIRISWDKNHQGSLHKNLVKKLLIIRNPCAHVMKDLLNVRIKYADCTFPIGNICSKMHTNKKNLSKYMNYLLEIYENILYYKHVLEKVQNN